MKKEEISKGNLNVLRWKKCEMRYEINTPIGVIRNIHPNKEKLFLYILKSKTIGISTQYKII